MVVFEDGSKKFAEGSSREATRPEYLDRRGTHYAFGNLDKKSFFATLQNMDSRSVMVFGRRIFRAVFT